MNKPKFVIALGKIVSSIAIPGNINNELDLEEILLPHVKSYVQESLQKTQEELKTIVYAHGKNKEEKKLWSESKKIQTITAFNCTMASDIFIHHENIGTIFVEIKLAKPRKSGGDSFPGSLQRAVGQTVIATMKHDYAICYIATPKRGSSLKNDISEKLIETLWKKLKILLLIKEY